jgi:hypothetical protein
VIRTLTWHPIQPRCDTVLISELFRHLLNEMIKAPLAKGRKPIGHGAGDGRPVPMPKGCPKGWTTPAGAYRLNGKRHPVRVICLGQMVPSKARNLLRSGLEGDLHEGPLIEMGKLVRNAPLILPATAAFEEKLIGIAELRQRLCMPICMHFVFQFSGKRRRAALAAL